MEEKEFRVYFAGQREPIHCYSRETINGLVQAYGVKNLLYIEDMEYSELIDSVLAHAKQKENPVGLIHDDGSLITYIGEKNQWMVSGQPVPEMDIRMSLQSEYIKDPTLAEEDRAYIESLEVEV